MLMFILLHSFSPNIALISITLEYAVSASISNPVVNIDIMESEIIWYHLKKHLFKYNIPNEIKKIISSNN